MSESFEFRTAGRFREAARFGVGGRFAADPEFFEAAVSDPVRFVEVGTQAVEAKVIRNGINVGVADLDQAVVGEIVGRPITRTKVVSQSIEAGVAVAKGTAVDLVLTRTGDLGLGVVKDIPEVFKQFTVDDAFNRFVQGRPEVRRLLLQNANFDTLTEADRGVITTVLADNGIQLSNQPGDDANAAFNAFQAIHTFGG